MRPVGDGCDIGRRRSRAYCGPGPGGKPVNTGRCTLPAGAGRNGATILEGSVGAGWNRGVCEADIAAVASKSIGANVPSARMWSGDGGEGLFRPGGSGQPVR